MIVERPRLGGDRGRKGRAVPLEDLPKQEGIRRKARRYSTKVGWPELIWRPAPPIRTCHGTPPHSRRSLVPLPKGDENGQGPD
jgi:hypothetical protein